MANIEFCSITSLETFVFKNTWTSLLREEISQFLGS